MRRTVSSQLVPAGGLTAAGRLFSPIAILSVFVMVQVPRVVTHARAHNVARHRGNVRGLVIGALLIAGFFTFPFNRLLGHWLFTGTSAAAVAPAPTTAT